MVIADGPTLSYRDLSERVNTLADALLALGVEAEDTIGLALRDGPDMATMFVATGAVAAAAPLNPNYRRAEFDFEIEDLDLKAMVVGMGKAEISPALDAATAAGIPVLRVDGASLTGASVGPAQDRRRNDTDAVALVLHTSGTTARPKIVPLRHRNIAATAAAIGVTLRLSADDRGCMVMPLFHIHGLMAGLSASLYAGASVICTPGFAAPDMARWLTSHEATWYTAVPTMHQALLDRARTQANEFADVRVRFIRSSSSSLAPVVMEELEATFKCPVVEAYGMTEAAHQMSCNPLPPAQRKPGSVGPAAGPEVAIMDADGNLLDTDEIGEVVIKGPNVMSGYHANEEANATAFTNGWFRTGDQGRIDTDGYVVLTGRLKEIINRGGEKVSPREVDEVMLEHPDVAQVVTFAVPDSRLGEQVAAAVVPTSDVPDAIDERALRVYVSERLAAYKVPRRVVVLETIPKGPSGKLQRIGLAEKLGLSELDAATTSQQPHQDPSSPGEELMAELWSDVLGRKQLSVHDHWLDVGGDSLGAARLLTMVREEIDVEISMLDFFDAPTIAEQGELVEDLLLASDDAESTGAG